MTPQLEKSPAPGPPADVVGVGVGNDKDIDPWQHPALSAEGTTSSRPISPASINRYHVLRVEKNRLSLVHIKEIHFQFGRDAET